jgi:hypothetical protein
MVTKEQAMSAREFEHATLKNADKTPLRARASGQCQTWKSRPGDFKLPCKYGLKQSFYITEANAADWRVAGTWVCHRCTDENERGNENCHTCGEPKKVAA